jgi:hypothetical protein
MDELPWNPRAIYMKSLRVGQMTKLPLEHKGSYTPLRGNMVKTWISSSGGQAFAAVRVLLTQAPQSRRVSPFIEASRRARISSPPAEPPVLVLWLNQATRWFCGEPPQTPHADTGCEPLPCINSCPWLRLAFAATMRPTLDPLRPLGPSSQAYLSLYSLEAPEGYDLLHPLFTSTNAN